MEDEGYGIWACAPARDAAPVRRFATYTPDLHQLADWLVACRIGSVAMEATGVYWLPVFEILEARGLQIYLINPHRLKHVPERKSDIQDYQWIQRLHSCGLLSNSFQAEAEMRALGAICASAARCSNIVRPTFSTCRRRCSR
jgi:transposase